MENQGSSLSLFDVEIDTYAQNHLNTISKWGRFISVAGFISLGLTALIMIMSGKRILLFLKSYWIGEMDAPAVMTPEEADRTLNIYSVVAIVYVVFSLVLCFFLLRSSTLFKRGLITRNSKDIFEGFSSLKNQFIVSIILTLVSVVLSVLSMIKF